jgi:choline dehydrogenase-like flavoprotein
MYDAIIVGARCAGSPTAMLLARKGYRVLWSTGPRFRATPSPRISSGRMAPRSWTQRSDPYRGAVAQHQVRRDTGGYRGPRRKSARVDGEGHASRDQRAKPIYDFTCQLATLEPPLPPMQRLFAALRGDQEVTNQFYSAITGSRPLPAFMNPENLDRIIARAGIRE